MARTLAFLHAHPDDEALLTSGTMARAVAEGQRVLLITATSGGEGLADADLGHGDELAGRRLAELRASADVLGVDRLVTLDYPDSGLAGDAEPADGARPFCQVPAPEVAERLAPILEQEGVDTLIGYDPSGGYGHPDHRHIHTVAVEVARRCEIPRLFAATQPRWPYAIVGGVCAAAMKAGARFPEDFDPALFSNAYLPNAEITHRVDVRDYLDSKRASMAAHASQATGGDVRTLGVLLGLPRPVFSAILGTEYYQRMW